MMRGTKVPFQNVDDEAVGFFPKMGRSRTGLLKTHAGREHGKAKPRRDGSSKGKTCPTQSFKGPLKRDTRSNGLHASRSSHPVRGPGGDHRRHHSLLLRRLRGDSQRPGARHGDSLRHRHRPPSESDGPGNRLAVGHGHRDERAGDGQPNLRPANGDADLHTLPDLDFHSDDHRHFDAVAQRDRIGHSAANRQRDGGGALGGCKEAARAVEPPHLTLAKQPLSRREAPAGAKACRASPCMFPHAIPRESRRGRGGYSWGMGEQSSPIPQIFHPSPPSSFMFLDAVRGEGSGVRWEEESFAGILRLRSGCLRLRSGCLRLPRPPIQRTVGAGLNPAPTHDAKHARSNGDSEHRFHIRRGRLPQEIAGDALPEQPHDGGHIPFAR